MTEILTHELRPGVLYPGQRQIYCALDAMVTFEVHEQLSSLTNQDPLIYNFERALQGPVLEIMQRGFLVDDIERRSALEVLYEKAKRLRWVLWRYADAIWGKELNPNSQKQLQQFFYGALRIPEKWTSKKGEKKLSMDRETLEFLDHNYFIARPIVATILGLRDVQKKIKVLETEISPDGRMRTSYNIAGTETGRFSSSAASDETGGNLQNITEELRRIFVADAGWKLCVIDGEQAEARDVGFLCGVLFDDWTYLDNCEAGDLHTLNTRLIWPNLPWSGNIKQDREIAEQPFYRDYTYRYMAKRGGHGSNYMGTPYTMARHLKVPVAFMEDFQRRYFDAVPAIPRWHQWTAEQIQTIHLLETPMGRRRHFFGRPNDDTTLREAIAYVPQSTTADRTNLGMYRLWRHFGTSIQLLAQTHDSVTFQYRERDELEIIPEALRIFEDIPLFHKGRKFIVPGECKLGWNWSAIHDDKKPISPTNRFNPNGLVKWKGQRDARSRLEGMNRPLP